MFTPVGSLLKSLPRRSKIPSAIMALYVREAFGKSLEEVCADLPKEALKTVKALTFKNGVLTIKAPGLVSAELTVRAGGLIGDINRKLGKRIVQRLRFRGF